MKIEITDDEAAAVLDALAHLMIDHQKEMDQALTDYARAVLSESQQTQDIDAIHPH